MVDFASFSAIISQYACFGRYDRFIFDLLPCGHEVRALANFKYKLTIIIAARLVLWLRLPKGRRKRAERSNRTLIRFAFLPFFYFISSTVVFIFLT
jgi:hypothetical protein